MTTNSTGPGPEAGRTTLGGRLLAGLGAAIALLVWAPRAAFSIDGGFEGHARDLSVVFVDLPLILLGGALIPLSAWTLTVRWTRRPWVAALAAVAALALGTWGLTTWWTPRQLPDPGYRGNL
ncbi:hypothetical protein OOK31_00965 [Streptomyces sp. NBC_00249]|uniref:hypothetical protein n=1 Tax=Streptomyces sp. NBC_00249 TaxID=2975690 RepID=UPI002258FA90|nr:hypothetical protein [Streptomyces sp. NBC_00249]MCX5192471.1 hypothetical protein [Streptomyces sp. NBC_00249]